jgi:hypothetical protein
MRWSITFQILGSSVVVLLLIALWWDFVEVLAMYAPSCGLFLIILLLLPYGFQLCRWMYTLGKKPPYPLAILAPVGAMLLFPLWPVAEKIPPWFPRLCEVDCLMTVKPSCPGKLEPKATFSFWAHGWGNPDLFEIQTVDLGYHLENPNKRYWEWATSQASALGLLVASPHGEGPYLATSGWIATRSRFSYAFCINLTNWTACHTDTYMNYKPITRERLLKFVRDHDFFPAGEDEVLADELWDTLHKFAEQRDLPPLQRFDYPRPRPQFFYWVRRPNIAWVNSCLASICLIVPSYLLACLYCWRGNASPTSAAKIQ